MGYTLACKVAQEERSPLCPRVIEQPEQSGKRAQDRGPYSWVVQMDDPKHTHEVATVTMTSHTGAQNWPPA